MCLSAWTCSERGHRNWPGLGLLGAFWRGGGGRRSHLSRYLTIGQACPESKSRGSPLPAPLYSATHPGVGTFSLTFAMRPAHHLSLFLPVSFFSAKRRPYLLETPRNNSRQLKKITHLWSHRKLAMHFFSLINDHHESQARASSAAPTHQGLACYITLPHE